MAKINSFNTPIKMKSDSGEEVEVINKVIVSITAFKNGKYSLCVPPMNDAPKHIVDAIFNTTEKLVNGTFQHIIPNGRAVENTTFSVEQSQLPAGIDCITGIVGIRKKKFVVVHYMFLEVSKEKHS